MGAIPVVVVGGWDPSGGAGVVRDLLTLQKLGVRASAVITAITSQDARARGRVFPLDPATVTAQIEGAWPRTPPVVKVGMVYSRVVLLAVADWLDRHPAKAVVVDPVLRSKGGLALATREALAVFPRLLAHATIATPNLEEARVLLGSEGRTLEPHLAALRFHRLGARRVLLKLPRSGPLKRELFFDGREYRWFTNRSAVHYDVRGTGCTLASAMAGHLAQRRPPVEAVADSLRWVRRLLGRTERVGHARFFA